MSCFDMAGEVSCNSEGPTLRVTYMDAWHQLLCDDLADAEAQQS